MADWDKIKTADRQEARSRFADTKQKEAKLFHEHSH